MRIAIIGRRWSSGVSDVSVNVRRRGQLFDFLPRNVSRATILYFVLSSINSWWRIQKDYDRQSEIFANVGMPQFNHAHRVWAYADRIGWESKHDSLFASLGRLRAQRVTCQPDPTMQRFVEGATYWRIDPYYLKIRAQKLERPLYLPKPWVLSIEAFSEMPFECRTGPKPWTEYGEGPGS